METIMVIIGLLIASETRTEQKAALEHVRGLLLAFQENNRQALDILEVVLQRALERAIDAEGEAETLKERLKLAEEAAKSEVRSMNDALLGGTLNLEEHGFAQVGSEPEVGDPEERGYFWVWDGEWANQREKISMIKAVRQLFQAGLLESRQFVEGEYHFQLNPGEFVLDREALINRTNARLVDIFRTNGSSFVNGYPRLSIHLM